MHHRVSIKNILARLVLLAYLPLAFTHSWLHVCDRLNDDVALASGPDMPKLVASHAVCIACHFVGAMPVLVFAVNGFVLVLSSLKLYTLAIPPIIATGQIAARAPPAAVPAPF